MSLTQRLPNWKPPQRPQERPRRLQRKPGKDTFGRPLRANLAAGLCVFGPPDRMRCSVGVAPTAFPGPVHQVPGEVLPAHTLFYSYQCVHI
jgi:hypothetical protein